MNVAHSKEPPPSGNSALTGSHIKPRMATLLYCMAVMLSFSDFYNVVVISISDRNRVVTCQTAFNFLEPDLISQ